MDASGTGFKLKEPFGGSVSQLFFNPSILNFDDLDPFLIENEGLRNLLTPMTGVGNDINFFGYAYPQSQINVIINSDEPIVDATSSDKFGYWNYKLNSQNLEMGDHTTKSQIVTPDSLKSPFSESVAFRVGDKDVAFGKLPVLPAIITLAAPAACNKNGDINNDKKINIVDFSIMLYFWNQRNPKNTCADVNGDGIVNLFDFSIMLFWWTG